MESTARVGFDLVAQPMKARRQEGNRVAVFCPACKCAHAVPLGTNQWDWNGSTEAPTIRPSLLVHGPMNFDDPNPDSICHSIITDGKILFAKDSTHALAGQTLDLEDF